VTAILEGRQPVELTARSLLRVADMPIAWNEQERALGFTWPKSPCGTDEARQWARLVFFAATRFVVGLFASETAAQIAG